MFAMEYYAAAKKKDLLTFETAWRNLLREISQRKTNIT